MRRQEIGGAKIEHSAINQIDEKGHRHQEYQGEEVVIADQQLKILAAQTYH